MEQLHNAEHRTLAPIEAVAGAWSYSPASSSLASALAACKQYGLLDEHGRGPDKMFQVSDRGFDIVVETQGSNEWIKAVQAAAFSPQIFSELFEQFGDHGSDANIRVYLLRKGFNAKATRPCIQNYRRTVEFVNSVGRDLAPAVESEKTHGIEAQTEMVQKTAQNTQQTAITPSPKDWFPITVVMDNGSNRVAYIPKMSEQSFEQFKSLLDVYRKGIIQQAGPPTIDDITEAEEKPAASELPHITVEARVMREDLPEELHKE